uniref:Uncharacterized protein n=1 Tax=Lactuca sativa TaxID=4236 RepID=A0A9R1XP79_LACSA|nr:hypothetical protein LSAT_V11C400188530 [Lactuca sativa]
MQDKKIERKTPLVMMWTTTISGFGFGNLIEQNLNLEGDKNENQETCIKEYEEKYEPIFNNVSTKKDNIEEIIFHCLSKFLEDNRTKEMIRKFRDIFSNPLFSSREKSEIMKERTEVKADRVEKHNKTNNSDFDDDKHEGMNTKLVEYVTVKLLQEKFVENQERQTEDQDMNVDDPIILGLESNIGVEIIGHPDNQERQTEFEDINIDGEINLALEGNNIEETVVKNNLEGNIECKNLVEGGEMIVGEKIREGNIVKKVFFDYKFIKFIPIYV